MPKPYKKPDYVGSAGRSVGDLTAEEALRDIGGLDEGELPDPGKIKRDHNAGRSLYKKELEAFAKLDDNAKIDALRETWKEVAMGAAVRAKAFVSTCSTKDFSSLQKLISAAATGLEQAFPRKSESIGTQFILNMFGSLGQRASAIAAPPVPTIDVTPVQEVPWHDLNLTETTSLLQATLENSPTTTPSASPLSDSSTSSKP